MRLTTTTGYCDSCARRVPSMEIGTHPLVHGNGPAGITSAISCETTTPHWLNGTFVYIIDAMTGIIMDPHPTELRNKSPTTAA